jgi:tetratricopeptide (TPR) repeat protein
LNLSLDKDTLLEFCSTKKDQIFLTVLVLVLVMGGWFLYQQSAMSVDDIIQETIGDDSTNPTDRKKDSVVSSENVISTLLSKRAITSYEVKRSPFGSQEEQYRMRQEVESTYQKGKELHEAGDYQAAIQQFDKVISLDVTETRISYPILPSEYKRRAQQEYSKKHLDEIMQAAEKDLQDGNRFVTAGNNKEAIDAFSRASKNLSDVIDSDPDGQNIGVDNLANIKKMQLDAYTKAIEIQRNSIREEMNRELTQSQQVLAGQDMIALLKMYFSLSGIQQKLDIEIDPNGTLISRVDRETLQARITQIQQKVTGNFPELISQAEIQFNEALAQGNLIKSQESIFILRQALSTRPNDKELANKINDYVSKRTDLVVQKAEQFIQAQQAILANNRFDEFDEQGKKQLLNDLFVLSERGSTLTPDLRKQVLDLQGKLRALTKPGPLTDLYTIVSVTPTGSRYKIVLQDKDNPSARNRTIYLKEGDPADKNLGISIKQVDTDQGFVILSKSGYIDVQINISASE